MAAIFNDARPKLPQGVMNYDAAAAALFDRLAFDWEGIAKMRANRAPKAYNEQIVHDAMELANKYRLLAHEMRECAKHSTVYCQMGYEDVSRV